MRIVLSGASGFIGSYLVEAFQKQKWEVISLSKEEFSKDSQILAKKIEGCSVIVHLAGENIFSFWTKQQKKRILESRVFSTRKLVEAISFLPKKPSLFLSASALGIYKQSSEVVTEESEKGKGFLPSVCKKWEKEAKKGEDLGVRTLFLRFGVVLGKGGFLQRAFLSARFKLYPILAGGKQCISWIDIEDLFRAICFIVKTPSLKGAVNFCSPFFISQKKSACVLNKGKTWVRIPSFLLPGFAKTLLLFSQKAYPKRLLENGFLFASPHFKETVEKYRT